MSTSDSDQRADYQAPTIAVIGSLQDLTAQKSGSEPDSFKGEGEGEISFPSGFGTPR